MAIVMDETVFLKKDTLRTGGVTQALDGLPSNCEDLISNTSTIKKGYIEALIL
jgi:hypothetical protein